MQGPHLQTSVKVAMATEFSLIYQTNQCWDVWHIFLFNVLQAHRR